MAQQVITSYIDDLDGSEAAGSVEFSLDGRQYEIDLSDVNASRLREALAPFVSAARRAGGRAASAARPRSVGARSREETQEIRSWLRANGHEVSDRGRISTELLEAWEARTPASTTPAAEQRQPAAAEFRAPEAFDE